MQRLSLSFIDAVGRDLHLLRIYNRSTDSQYRFSDPEEMDSLLGYSAYVCYLPGVLAAFYFYIFIRI